MKLSWSQYGHRPITLAESDQKLGGIMATFFNPENGQVLAFLIGLGRVLTPMDVSKWTKDGLEVANPEAFVAPNDILRLEQFGFRRCLLNNKRVLSKTGRYLGRVRDFTVDTKQNQLIQIHVVRRFLFWIWKQRTFSAGDISEITEKFIQLRLEPDDPNAKIEVPEANPLLA